jgi:hypothetical protein
MIPVVIRRPEARLCCALLALPGVGWALAGTQDRAGVVDRPSSAERVTRRFDFEERDTNPTDLPRDWIRAQHDPPSRERPGFPIWNQARLDDTVRASGAGSVRLPTRGGSTSLLLDPGVVPVFPDADYLVSARVRTEGVAHARARLAVRLLDASGRPLPASEATSPSVRTEGVWETLLVHVPGNESRAASLQIELLLEQPGPAGVLPFGDLEIVPHDYTGSAWFDEIAVMQVPRVELWTGWPGNLIPGDRAPEVSLFLRDLVGQALEITLIALDLNGREVDRARVDFEGGRLEQTWTPALGGAGWYRVRAIVTQGGEPVGSAFTDLIWRAPGVGVERGAPRPRESFAFSVSGVPTEGLEELGALTLASGMGRVATELWHEGAPIDEARQRALTALAGVLSPANRELSVVVPGLPPEISDLRGALGAMTAFADAGSDGAAWLDPILIELGHRVRWWRVGGIGEHLDGGISPDFGAASSRVRQLVPGAVLEFPWSPFMRLEPGLVGAGLTVAQGFGPGLDHGEIGAIAGAFKARRAQSGGAGWDLPRHEGVLAGEDADRIGASAAIDGMLRAALWTWATVDGQRGERGRSLRLDRAWRWQGGRRPQLMPLPSAAAWLTLMEMLEGRIAEPLGELAPGFEGMLLTGIPGSGKESVLAFWPRGGGAPAGAFSLLLAPGAVRVVDRFGNASWLEPESIEPTVIRTHRIRPAGGGVGYVAGVDADLVRFAAWARVEPGFIETRAAATGAELVIRNPWDAGIRGKYFIVEPGGFSSGELQQRDRSWEIMPRNGAFVIDGRGEARIPVDFSASAGVESGERELVLDFDLESPTASGLMRMHRRMETGLGQITMDLSARFEPAPDGPGVVVYAEITNTGSEREVVQVFASAPGFARQRSAGAPLAPGQRVVKSFAFEGGREALAGQPIHVGLFIRETGGRMLKRITVDGR